MLIASKIDAGTRWVTKSLRLNAAVSTPLAAVAGGKRQVEPDARLEQIDQHQAERERDKAGADEPAERPRGRPGRARRCRPCARCRRPASRTPAAR